FRVLMDAITGRPAGDHQLDVRQLRQGEDHVGDPLAFHQPAHDHNPKLSSRPWLGRTVWTERPQVDAAWNDRDSVAIPSHPHQLEHLITAGGDDVVDAANDGDLFLNP